MGSSGTFAVRSHQETRFDYLAEELRADRDPDTARLRASLRAAIDGAIHRHTMTRAEAHVAAGLPAKSLDDGSLDTDALRQALATLRALPGGMWDPYAALGVNKRRALTPLLTQTKLL